MRGIKVYINLDTFVYNYTLLQTAGGRNQATQKKKLNLERTSGLMYFLGVDKVQKVTGSSVVEIHRDQDTKRYFTEAMSELLVLGVDAQEHEYQANFLGEITVDTVKISNKTNKNFLSTQVSRAVGNPKGYPTRPPQPLLSLGAGATQSGVTKSTDWLENIPVYLNFRECGEDSMPLIVFLLRNTDLIEDEDDLRLVITEGLARHFTDEVVDFLMSNASFSNLDRNSFTSELWEINQLPESLFRETEENAGVEEHVAIEEEDNLEEFPDLVIDSEVPRNKIIYGAPGTGKSFQLNKEVNDHFKSESLWERVTFYSNYTYGQFIGTYKPVPLYATTEREIFNSDQVTKTENQREPLIDYQFVPGPFLSMLVKALKNPKSSFVLLIEEINRADSAGVFGDVFQLLDRDEKGESEYGITFNPDVMNYLKKKNITSEKIKLPSNFFVWATMNSADQGVAPMDTAFKRRWSFEYLSLNKNQEGAQGNIHLPFMNGEEVSWNKFRTVINNRIKDIVPEDKLIGPFFLKTHELNDPDVFKNKLLLYLRDDVLRYNYEKLFSKNLFSDIVEAFDRNENIFIFSEDELRSDN